MQVFSMLQREKQQNASTKNSMSRRGNFLGSAVAESFFSSLKKERIKRRIYSVR
jgi:transposase InsO family protein